MSINYQALQLLGSTLILNFRYWSHRMKSTQHVALKAVLYECLIYVLLHVAIDTRHNITKAVYVNITNLQLLNKISH